MWVTIATISILQRQALYIGETKEGQRLLRPGTRVVDNDLGRTVMTAIRHSSPVTTPARHLSPRPPSVQGYLPAVPESHETKLA
jgi:hypothetical protein